MGFIQHRQTRHPGGTGGQERRSPPLSRRTHAGKRYAYFSASGPSTICENLHAGFYDQHTPAAPWNPYAGRISLQAIDYIGLILPAHGSFIGKSIG